MKNEEKAQEICARNAANCCRDCDDCTGGREFYNLVEMAAWKDKQLMQLCRECERRIGELGGKACAFRSLGNDYCWK